MADPVAVQVSGMGLVVGPDDVLVISHGGLVTQADFEGFVALVNEHCPALKGRVLMTNAEQLAVIQGVREPT